MPSAAPAEGHGGAPAYFDAQHEAARQATNNYARADGQARGAGGRDGGGAPGWEGLSEGVPT